MNWIIIGSDASLSPVGNQAITWANDDISSIRFSGINPIDVWFKSSDQLRDILWPMRNRTWWFSGSGFHEVSWPTDQPFWNSINRYCGLRSVKVRSHCVRVRIRFSIRFSFRVRRTVYTESEFLSVFDLISCPQLPRQTSKCDFV